MTNKKINEKKVTDEFGQEFKLVHKIGQGGQGVVCSTQFDKVLVKISTQRDISKKNKWLEHIRWLMKQPLEQLNIAKPFSRIAKNGNAGYAMELMDGLMPLKQLMDDTEQQLVDSGSPEQYLKSGGIKRRMNLLAKLARTLADLHGRGLAYGDLSPANIYISDSVEYSEVWLIDCDNICINQRESFDSTEIEGRAGRVFSPGYGAPEVINGDHCISSLTDSWSFAVIAMKLLTTNHPFVGELVDNGTPEDEAAAFAGEYAWVHHPTDSSNESFKGIPLDLVTLKPLKELFEQCFNAGKDEPLARPTLSKWAEVFEMESHLLVNCQNKECQTSFNFLIEDKKLVCPFCDAEKNKNQVLYIRNYLQDLSILKLPNTKSKDTLIATGYNQTLNQGDTLILKNSPPGSLYWHESSELLSIVFNASGLEIKPLGAKSFEIGFSQDKRQVFNSKTEWPMSTRSNKWLVIKPLIDSEEPEITNLYILKW